MVTKAETLACIAVIKVRGTISAQREVKETLSMLHLLKTNHAVLLNNNPSLIGMLYRVQNYVTWGEPSKEIVAMLLKKRGRMSGDKKLTDEYAQKIGFKSIDALAEAIVSCKMDYKKLPDIQPMFKLRPPSKGFKGKTKKSYKAGGEAGYRGKSIDDLLKRMM